MRLFLPTSWAGISHNVPGVPDVFRRLKSKREAFAAAENVGGKRRGSEGR
jgi:hypothetical protein